MPARSARRRSRLGCLGAVVALAGLAQACGPLIDRAAFPARPDSLRPADLLGPYDGVVVDAETDRPIAGAVVAGSWAFERGIGAQGPVDAEEIVTETGADGRYALPRLQSLPAGLSTRLRRFTLIVYRRGYVAWRSDRLFPHGKARLDFSQRANRVSMERWQTSLAHAQHLAFLGGGAKLREAAAWEASAARLELEGESASRRTAPGSAARPELAMLDVASLLTEDEIRGVTGYVGRFNVGKLTDLPTTEFYDSRHFKAEGRPESFDVGLRVWRLGPAAAEVQYQKLAGELPGATHTDEIGDLSFRARSGGTSPAAAWIEGLVFLVREHGICVSLTCGSAQCAEPAQILRLGKLVESRLPDLPEAAPQPAPESKEPQ